MEPSHVGALVVFVLLLSAAALELFGTWRFTAYLRSVAKRRPPNNQ